MDDAEPLQIRPMVLADCDRVSEIRVLGWQFAYRGLMPQPFLDALSAKDDAERRRARFAQDDGSVVSLVASRGEEIVGWAAFGPYRDGEIRTGEAELYAIYLDPRHLNTGAGRALMQEALRRCAALGHDRVYLWVVRGNARARRFYERAGFRADGAEEPYEVDGVLVPELRYVRELTR
ncbi:L-amino acid N-acyltransferase YncA [Streptomyces sp. 3213]|uniref:GNAT family N-acetyltransferase n=1 Tax=Streptomyces sp. 3213.3 TaxID=1855348 RepID=UPI000894D986|nr:GNAT family N-acetyltransferase [Streptomyces sp. 3213.3]SEE73613.1 L-amino acid N-acyltransferase YncA [Streptomyces sp. 3213] [Streptomyces sp. 3213.3]